jgi:hypothetical protein
MNLDETMLQTKTALGLISLIRQLTILCKKNGIKSNLLSEADDVFNQHRRSLSKMSHTKGLGYRAACKKILELRYDEGGMIITNRKE